MLILYAHVIVSNEGLNTDLIDKPAHRRIGLTTLNSPQATSKW